MISVHESLNQHEVHKGWLSPFLDDPNLWLPFQQSPIPHTLEEVAVGMVTYSWSTAQFKNQHRSNSDVIANHYIALDFDAGKTLDWAKETFADYACIIGTTRSHQLLKNGIICDRFRVTLRLAEPIKDPDVFKATAKYLIERYGSDKQCSDAARFFFRCETIDFIGPEDGDMIVPLPKPLPPKPSPKPKRRARGDSTLPLAIKKFQDGGGFDKGQRNNAIYQAGRDYCKILGYSFQQAYSEMRGLTDETESRFTDTLKSAFKDGRQ